MIAIRRCFLQLEVQNPSLVRSVTVGFPWGRPGGCPSKYGDIERQRGALIGDWDGPSRAGALIAGQGHLAGAPPVLHRGEPVLAGLEQVAEAGLPGYETVAWFGVLAPAGTYFIAGHLTVPPGVTLQGVGRARIKTFEEGHPFLQARIERQRIH